MFARAGITTSPDPDAFAAAAGHVAVFQVRPAPPARRNQPDRAAAPRGGTGA
jgi:hypothetical protein